jgi:hypothetical protein
VTRQLVTVVVVAAWLGAAALAAAVVAPAAFAVLPTRALAGALVGRVLPALFVTGVVVGATAAALQWGAGGRGIRLALPLLVAVACAAAQFAVAPRIARLRAEIGPSVDALAVTDPRRRAFGRLHGVSVLLLGAAGLAAAGTLVAASAALRGRGW